LNSSPQCPGAPPCERIARSLATYTAKLAQRSWNRIHYCRLCGAQCVDAKTPCSQGFWM
jgi:hypothetical protein